MWIAEILFFQLFDRKFVDAILQEWYKTMMDLPAGLRQAYEMVSYSDSSQVFIYNFFQLGNLILKAIIFRAWSVLCKW